MRFCSRPTTLPLALTLITLSTLSLGTLAGCQKQEVPTKSEQHALPSVDVQVVELGNLPITHRLSGRVFAYESAEVRPQATGIIDEVLFKEGSMVQAGQPLYRVNTDSYTSSVAANEAALNQAHANIGTARANIIAQQALFDKAQADLARYESLLQIDAISRQTYDQAITNAKTAEAALEQARANLASSEATARSAEAALNSSRLDLSRTIIRAPISGKSGISAVSKGALVSSGQAAPLVTISRLDLVYVDITQSSSELLALRQSLATGEVSQGSADVQLRLDDNTLYPLKGQLTLSSAHVDEATGSVTLRAVFPNPDGILLPGMYVNAEVNQRIINNATLLPNSAITLTAKGDAEVYIVDKDNKIQTRQVTTVGTFEGQWVVSSGLKTGEKVVILGKDKVKPEQEVTARTLSPAEPTPATTKPTGSNSVLAPAKQPQAPQPNTQTNSQDLNGQTPSQAPPRTSNQGQPTQVGNGQTPSVNAPNIPSSGTISKPQAIALSPEEAEAMAAADDAGDNATE